jgi:hypothetical protein
VHVQAQHPVSDAAEHRASTAHRGCARRIRKASIPPACSSSDRVLRSVARRQRQHEPPALPEDLSASEPLALGQPEDDEAVRPKPFSTPTPTFVQASARPVGSRSERALVSVLRQLLQHEQPVLPAELSISGPLQFDQSEDDEVVRPKPKPCKCDLGRLTLHL